ncbi:MAG: hypothetical protein ACYDBQ_04255 [Thermoplasmatota archaeon]
MAMSVARVFLYAVGIALVVAALAMFYYNTNLNRWVPVSILVAGILLVIGLAVMGFAEEVPTERRENIEEYHPADTTTIVRRRD